MSKLTKKDIKIGDKFKVIQNCKYINKIITVKKIYEDDGFYDFEDKEYNICWILNRQVVFVSRVEQHEEGRHEGHPEIYKNLLKETIKNDEGKPDFTLIPQEALLELAKVFTYGANKYAKDNYSLGTNYRRYIAAAHRHINQWLRNQDIDDETQTNHLANAAASLLMVLDNQLTNKGTDDRNKTYKIK